MVRRVVHEIRQIKSHDFGGIREEAFRMEDLEERRIYLFINITSSK